ncbi:ABC transporter ATP-binding protein [Candidatus Daviesbacteria bacterium]|nr:ABC transporter ATP-binding protein [Candidatus Daviesbacteria bacterium]
MLKIINLSKRFAVEDQEIRALDGLNLEVDNGEFCTIIGPSGCGKSTLLRIIAGLETKTTGELIWDNPPKLGYVFQNYALFPYLTVFENIEFGLKMEGVALHDRTKIVLELIEEVGLTGFEDKHPKELSGGMKQRVGIARSLSIEPNVLLLDEPFSSVDEFTAESLRDLLLKLWHKRKITIIMVTHLIREALEMSDQIVVMTPRPGTVEKILENELKRPRNLRSDDFFKMEDKLRELIKF